MLYFYVSVAYTVTILLLAITLYSTARGSLISRFYVFCAISLIVFGLSVFILDRHMLPKFAYPLEALAIFLYSLVPYFFLHFIVIFLRRHEILKSRLVFIAIYGTGLFSYLMVLTGKIPGPISPYGNLEPETFVYYVTWMSIFFSIGIAMLYSMLHGFTERLSKSNFLLSAFGLLMLILPSPFTESLHHIIFRDRTELYGLTSAGALIIATYLIFRHKIMMTVYDSVRSALNVLHDIFLITDSSFNITIIRGALGRIGYSEQDMAGCPLNQFLLQKFYIEHYLTYVRSGRMRECRFDADLIGKHGATLLMDFSFSPIFEQDQLSGFVGIARDISEQRKNEALRASEARFRRLAEDAQDILYKFRFAPERGFEYVSPSAERITGYRIEEFYGNPDLLLFIVHPAQRRALEVCFAGMGDFSGTLTMQIIRKDGITIWLEQRTTPVYDERGMLTAMGAIARDITDRMRLEEELRQAQKLESMGTLAGGVAHDFNNILGIILGYASQLGKENLSPEARSHVDIIKQAIDRATGTVRELLTIARKSETRFSAVDINRIISELAGVLGSTLPKTITFALDLDNTLPTVQADPDQLHQALLNICLNARDAMPEGGNLTISTRRMPAPDMIRDNIAAAENEYVRIRITDTGTGIPADVKERIFEPFYTTKDIGKGTGLGLALVQGIVKAHQGCITVDSWPDEGTTFDVFLPSLKSKISGEQTPPLPESIHHARGNETILFVEDEEMLLDLVSEELEHAGYAVITAKTGSEALEKFTWHSADIDLVLTDVSLPGMNGWNLFQVLRQRNKNVKVLFASGFLEPSMHAEMIMHGAKHFIQKPYRPAEILEKVREMLDEEQAPSNE